MKRVARRGNKEIFWKNGSEFGMIEVLTHSVE